jgi:hypothetical protein
MTRRNFSHWFSKFKSSISDYSFYVDFSKVYRNVDAIKVELSILNSLIASKNIKDDFVSIEEKWNTDLSEISNQGKTEKRFDFVIKTPSMIYGIEANFYSSSGSKLNETARSYKTLAQEAKLINGFVFVWFTDGNGWSNAKNNLEETFDIMEHIYSIDDMENGIMNLIFK